MVAWQGKYLNSGCSTIAKTIVVQPWCQLLALSFGEIISTSPQQSGTHIKKGSGSRQNGIQNKFNPFWFCLKVHGDTSSSHVGFWHF